MTPAELVDEELARERVAVTSLQNGTLSYFDSQRRLQQASVQRFVQLRAIGGREAQLSPGEAVVEMTDSQRFVGQWAGGNGDGDTLRWEHAELGTLYLPLDRIKAVRFTLRDGEAADVVASGPTPAQDTITLVNGDRLHGFVLELTDTAIVLMPDGGAEPWTLPHQRIAQLRLANPDERPQPGRQVMVLGDGSRVHVAGLALGRDQVRYESSFQEASQPGVMAIQHLAGIDFTAHGRRLVPLADHAMHVTAGGEVFGLPQPPQASGGTLRLHAPVTVTFDLPETAQRFAAVAELDTGDDAPLHLPDWADFELIVHPGTPDEAAGQRYRLSGSQPRVEINVPLDTPSLTLELDPGVNGPILDRLRLREAMLLIHEPVDPSSASEARW